MPSIESLGTPLAFKVRPRGEPPAAPGRAGDGIFVRAQLRALAGMQKEALVYHAPSGTTWRMVSDEGPYLNGTDLAPFPLAFYTAGVVFSFMSEALTHAARLGVRIDALEVTSDHRYTMEGSALRGDMMGGALPIEMAVAVAADAPPETVARILELAQASSPAEAYMRQALANLFTLTVNGRGLELVDLPPAGRPAADPGTSFAGVEPADPVGFLPDAITKLAAARVVHGVEGGAGSSLAAEQKRTLHVRGEARLVQGALKEIAVHLLRPIGSSFRLLSEEGEAAQAPPALAYLSAGVGFCYMTQLGRYAHITRKHLEACRVVQDNLFRPGEAAPGEIEPALAEPVETHVFLTLDEPDAEARKMVAMGERTCFLHAAMRGVHPTRLRLVQPTGPSGGTP